MARCHIPLFLLLSCIIVASAAASLPPTDELAGLYSCTTSTLTDTAPRYGIMRRGAYAVFSPYSGVAVEKKNRVAYLKPQTPVLVLNRHESGAPFVKVENDTLRGYVRDGDVFTVDEQTFRDAITAQKVLLTREIAVGDVAYPVATALMLDIEDGEDYHVRIVTEHGIANVSVPRGWAARQAVPESREFARISRHFLESPYAWGGAGSDGWDCSGLMQDYFEFFGLRLPRHSSDQVAFVEKTSVKKMSLKKKSRLLAKAKPYLTLLYFPGHIMLYTGKQGRELMSFQAIGGSYQKVTYLPLIKTGLMRKVTAIGRITFEKGRELTRYWAREKAGLRSLAD